MSMIEIWPNKIFNPIFVRFSLPPKTKSARFRFTSLSVVSTPSWLVKSSAPPPSKCSLWIPACALLRLHLDSILDSPPGVDYFWPRLNLSHKLLGGTGSTNSFALRVILALSWRLKTRLALWYAACGHSIFFQ